MADYRTGDVAVWLGNKDIQQAEINKVSAQLAGMGVNDPNYIALMNKLGGLKAGLEAEMQKQGATDQYGRLIQAKDVSGQYVDKDYLALRQQQMQDEATGALSSGLKLAKQQQMQTGQTDLGQAIAQQEAIQRQQSQQFGQEYKSEKELGYQKAGQQLQQNAAYATQLSNAERQDIMDQINAAVTNYNMTAAQLQTMNQTLANMPDGFLQQMASLIAKGAGGAIIGYLTGGVGNIASGITTATMGG